MAITNTLIDHISANSLFTASTGTEQAITTMIFCNTSPLEDAKLDIWLVPFGQVPGTPLHQILKQVPILRTETFVLDSEKFILSSGDKIFGSVSGSNNPINLAGAVNACISSVQV